ncbi:hypothetical protein C8R45DRAFT_946213 [Mycena sanguinolenta]|nr:hypothetical protein C8R45DRAFT_946213 [Mycena sanguinolenta]
MLTTPARSRRGDSATNAPSAPLPTMITHQNQSETSCLIYRSFPSNERLITTVRVLATRVRHRRRDPVTNAPSAPLPTTATKADMLKTNPSSTVQIPSDPTPRRPRDPAINALSVLCPSTQMWLATKCPQSRAPSPHPWETWLLL